MNWYQIYHEINTGTRWFGRGYCPTLKTQVKVYPNLPVTLQTASWGRYFDRNSRPISCCRSCALWYYIIWYNSDTAAWALTDHNLAAYASICVSLRGGRTASARAQSRPSEAHANERSSAGASRQLLDMFKNHQHTGSCRWLLDLRGHTQAGQGSGRCLTTSKRPAHRLVWTLNLLSPSQARIII